MSSVVVKWLDTLSAGYEWVALLDRSITIHYVSFLKGCIKRPHDLGVVSLLFMAHCCRINIPFDVATFHFTFFVRVIKHARVNITFNILINLTHLVI